jgi:hypothetical protein
VHFFELRLDRLPELQLDNREIIGARLISPSELRHGADRTGRRLSRQDDSAGLPFRVTAQRYCNVHAAPAISGPTQLTDIARSALLVRFVP